MAGLKVIRRRNRSVNNTKKITYAMKLVSAAKMRKAQEAVASSKEYTLALGGILAELQRESSASQMGHPLLVQHETVKRICFLVVGGSRGLCGGFNTNLNRLVEASFKEHSKRGVENIEAVILGRKPAEYFRKVQRGYLKSHEELSEDPNTWPIEEICTELESNYLDGNLDEVYLIYTKFRSAISSKPICERLLPMDPAVMLPIDTANNAREGSGAGRILFEPSAEQVFAAIVPRVLRSIVRQACLETKASEHGSRMAAMDAATKNAGELAHKLKLKLNKLRQSGITGELLDIIGGANAIS